MNKIVPPNEHDQHLQKIKLVYVSMLASYKNTAQKKLTGWRFSYSLSALEERIHTVLVQAVNSETLTKCLRLVLFKALFILDLLRCCCRERTGLKVVRRVLAIQNQTSSRVCGHPSLLLLPLLLSVSNIKIELYIDVFMIKKVTIGKHLWVNGSYVKHTSAFLFRIVELSLFRNVLVLFILKLPSQFAWITLSLAYTYNKIFHILFSFRLLNMWPYE